jgi:GDP-L-fucose synthase
MEKNSRILVTGCQGMAGWALIRDLKIQRYTNVTGIDRVDCDLLYRDRVDVLFRLLKPEYVFHVAAKVGGIYANNTQSADFTYENLMIQNNVMEAAKDNYIKKLIFCGSACIYPKHAPQPIKEEYLLSGPLEETNKGYAIAKIAGVIMTQMYRKQYGCNFISAMPTNLYGIGDNFHPTDSHVMPALIRKFHDAKLFDKHYVEVWGTGTPKREFLYIDDLAQGLIFLMNNYDGEQHINIGTGKDIPITDLVSIIKNTIGFTGETRWSGSLDGVLERRLDVTKINELGWKAKMPLEEGIAKTYRWYVNAYDSIRK